MILSEVSDLLTLASGFDRRIVDRVSVQAWHAVLRDVDYQQAQAAVIAHQTGPLAREYLTVIHIVDAVRVASRSRAQDVETDVRAAKARKIIPADWPDRQELDAGAAERLRAAREADRAAAVALGDGGGLHAVTAADLGVVMKYAD